MIRIGLFLVLFSALYGQGGVIGGPKTYLPNGTTVTTSNSNVPAQFWLREARANGTNVIGLQAPSDLDRDYGYKFLGQLPPIEGWCLSGDIDADTPAYARILLVWKDCQPTLMEPVSPSAIRPTNSYSLQAPELRIDTNGQVWRVNGVSNATDEYLRVVTPGSVEMFTVRTKAGGSPDFALVLNGPDVIPPTNDYGKLGRPGAKWGEAHITDLYIDTCTGTGCPGSGGWTRDGSGYLIPTTDSDDVRFRRWQMMDYGGGALSWDFRADVGNPAATTVKAYMRDNAGATVQEWERTFLGSASNISRLDMSLEPMTDATRAFGTSSKRWTNGYINDLYALRLRPSAGSSLEAYADLIPDGDLARGLGSVSRRWADIRTHNITITGTCTGCGAGYWSRDGSGYIIPATASDDVRFRKWVMMDSAGGGTFWDLQGDIGNPASTTVKAYMRDNSGTTVQEWERTFLGSASNISRLDMSLEPMTDAARNFGSSSKRWVNGYITDVYTLRLKPSAGSSLEIYGDLNPDGDNTRGLGSAFRKWADIRTQNITISGTCTGCPGGAVTDGGSTTYVTATGDSFAVGTTSTSSKFEVSGGSSTFGGSLLFSFDNAYSLGSSFTRANTLYTYDLNIADDILCSSDGACNIGNGSGSDSPGNVYATAGMFVMNGAGSSVVRASISGSGLIVRDSSGNQTATVNATNGYVDASGGYRKSGSTGVTQTLNVATSALGTCTITVTGGIITASTC